MTGTSMTTLPTVRAEMPQPATAMGTTKFADAGLRQHLQRMRRTEQAAAGGTPAAPRVG